MILAPIVLVGLGAFSPSVDAWSQLWNGPLPEMLWTTAILLILVGAGTIVLGTALAWLTTAYNFPGRRVFTWALMLPLAMPAYILGFVFLALFDFAGPVQTALRWAFGPGVWFPDVSSVGGVAIVMSLSLYPYVYILARSALREQTPATYEAARMLGDTRRAALLRVVLPMARPSLAAGAALVMMETLTDFATVQYFNVQTASVGVYQVWRGMFDRETAVELAALVLFIALVVMGIERVLRGPARFHQRGAPRDIERVDLSGWRRLFATGACGVVLGAAIVIPVAQLLYWLATSPAVVTDMSRALEFLSNSLALAVAAAAGAVFFAFVAAAGARFSGRSLVRRAAHLVTVGYAVPGPVVAIGVLVMIGWVTSATNPGGVVLVSLSGLVYAYIVRFMAMAYGSVDASLEKVTPSTVDAAHTLGASPSRVMRQIYFPMAGAGAAAGAVLVAIDVLKELPIVLLIRPFGFTTASVWVWELASESRWASAAIPALLIVVTAVIPIALYLRRERRSRGSAVALETRLTTAGRI
ncbi:MAG TPA: iron ABC transporter permease [Acidimicrobiia bacterium]|nr:iron ABC transporter permease [Acidimicrobiia bacterium]